MEINAETRFVRVNRVPEIMYPILPVQAFNREELTDMPFMNVGRAEMCQYLRFNQLTHQYEVMYYAALAPQINVVFVAY